MRPNYLAGSELCRPLEEREIWHKQGRLHRAGGLDFLRNITLNLAPQTD